MLKIIWCKIWPCFREDFIFAGLIIKSKLEREHIYHLYVVADFDARGWITDL